MKLLRNFLIYGVPAIVVIGGLLVAANMLSARKADAKKPWSVLVKSYRQKEDAELAVDRLKKMKFEAYYVPKMGKNNDIWFDVQAGAFKTEKEAAEVKEKLYLANIKDLEVLDYANYAGDMNAYNNAKPEDKKVYRPGPAGNEMPEIPADIVTAMRRFPVDRNYKIIDLRLADAPAVISNNIVSIGFKLDGNFIPGDKGLYKIIRSSRSLSQALYEDKLLENQIDVLILSLTNRDEDISALTNPYYYGGIAERDIEYRTDSGTLRGRIFRMTVHGNEIYTFIGKIENSGYFVFYRTYDLSLKDLTAFISNNSGDNGLLLYPEVIKNLSVFPKKSNSGSVKLAAFSMFRIPWTYAQERNFSWWSKNMVGYWNLNGYYMYNNMPVAIDFFNLDYTKTASAIHNNFINEKRKTLNNMFLSELMKDQGVFNRPVEFNNTGGWFLDKKDLNELSFTRGAYIIAIDSFYPRKSGYANLKAAAADLNIW